MKSVKANVSFPKMEEELLDVWKADRTFYKSNDKRKLKVTKSLLFTMVLHLQMVYHTMVTY